MFSPRQLSNALADLLSKERVAMAEFILALAAFDQQRAWEQLGFANLFDYLRRELGLSSGAAFYRKTAAVLVQQYPELVDPLRDGRLCLTSLGELSKVLTPENRAEVVPRFFHSSRREAQVIAAQLQPRACVPQRTVIAALPGRIDEASVEALRVPSAEEPRASAPDVSRATTPTDPRAIAPSEPRAEAPHDARSTAPVASNAALQSQPSAPAERGASAGSAASVPPSHGGDMDRRREVVPRCERPAMAAQASRLGQVGREVAGQPASSVEPVAANVYRLHATVSETFVRKLRAAAEALSHAWAGAKIEEILEAGLDLILRAHAKRNGLVDKPRSTTSRPSKDPGYIPAHVKREVFHRDKGCCQWRLENGGICGSRVAIEYDHIIPKGRGGRSVSGNVRLLCSRHNKLAARQEYGTEFVRKAVSTALEKRRLRKAEAPAQHSRPAPSPQAAATTERDGRSTQTPQIAASHLGVPAGRDSTSEVGARTAQVAASHLGVPAGRGPASEVGARAAQVAAKEGAPTGQGATARRVAANEVATARFGDVGAARSGDLKGREQESTVRAAHRGGAPSLRFALSTG